MARIMANAQSSFSKAWTFAETDAGALGSPRDFTDTLDWRPAIVPGTAAQALRALGEFAVTAPRPLDHKDFWYRATIEGAGRETLRFHGLATIAQVFLDGKEILSSASMFLSHDVDVDLDGRHELAICFRALRRVLEKPAGRARWRPRLAQPGTLRAVRTTLLGHMPGWCPPVHAIGPYRPIERIAPMGDGSLRSAHWRAMYENGRGLLEIAVSAPGAARIEIVCAGARQELTPTREQQFAGTVMIDGARPWFPHTHGEPALHDVIAAIDGKEQMLGRAGFRSIALDRDEDGRGFGLLVNGVPVFCRGAVWTPPDIAALPCAREQIAPLLALAQEAHFNMLRVSGATLYEGDAFYELCDERGILVWQDFMFSNFDYPASDEAFVALVDREAREFLARTLGSPSIAVLCGGSEVAQQAAMLGLPRNSWSNRIFDETLATAAADLRPDAIYLPNTPHGGVLPFEPAEGVCHYYGVSAYMRPIEDARHARVRFAAESLGHAHVPDHARILLEDEAPRFTHPRYGERVPGDVGATWFFEDVRNHYLRELYGIDPAEMRRAQPDRFINLSRAVTGELIENVFALWRRAGSPTRGGLVWFWQDLIEEAGWGVVDALGQPKPAWHALKRAFRPVQVLLIDEGLNGLHVHLVNETAQSVAAKLSLVCLRDGAAPVMRAERDLVLAPRSASAIAAVEMWGAFFDTNYAYRFGPPSHDVTIATLTVEDRPQPAAQAFHFPLGRGAERRDLGLAADLFRDEAGWALRVSAQRLAQSLHVRDAAWRPDDNWFHLPPGEPRVLRLTPRKPDERRPPHGLVSAVNSLEPACYRERP
jgi:beta-mannosidase